MKKCKCKFGRFLLKLLGVALVANVALFIVFFFDLDGKLLYYGVRPILNKVYNSQKRDVKL